jgi:hypothetical protein
LAATSSSKAFGHTSATLKTSLAARPDVKRLLLDFAPVNFIDTSAADGLLSLIHRLQNRAEVSPLPSRACATLSETICALPV